MPARPPEPGGQSDAGVLPSVRLYTDGACSGNPGPGGWAFILRHEASGKQIERSGGEPATTNNRMELMAIVMGLRALTRPARVRLVSDSEYALKGLGQWLEGWKRRGWKTAGKQPVKNQDLWEELDALVGGHSVEFEWIRGHAGHAENERCDQLAVEAIRALRSGEA